MVEAQEVEPDPRLPIRVLLDPWERLKQTPILEDPPVAEVLRRPGPLEVLEDRQEVS
jgi:hypothetical protein